MDIVIVFYLHYLVALAEKSKARIQLVFIIRRRIYKRLEYFVEIYRAGLALFRRAKHLYISKRRIRICARQSLGIKLRYRFRSKSRGLPFHQKEVAVLSVCHDFFTVHYTVCVGNYEAAHGLTENLLQLHHRQKARFN